VAFCLGTLLELQRHVVGPQRYLTTDLATLPATSPEELDRFLPDVWKREDAAEPILRS
jgi:transposase